MKRTIPPAQPKGLGLVVRTRMPHQRGTDVAIERIRTYMIPKLKEAGYGSRVITGETFKRKFKDKSYFKGGKIHPKLLLSEAGIFLEIWLLENPKYQFVVHPFVIPDLQSNSLSNRPRMDLNNEVLTALEGKPEGIHLKLIYHLFFSLDLHFLIMTETGMFWLDKYTSLKEENCVLTWRKDPNRLDRIAVKPKIQEGKFFSIKKELVGRLQTNMYYFNKNNSYGNQ